MRPKLTPSAALALAVALHQADAGCDSRLEAIMAQDAQTAFFYALQVLESRFPQAEDRIALSGTWSYMYAAHVIGEPWPMGEVSIARSGVDREDYARFLDVHGDNEDIIRFRSLVHQAKAEYWTRGDPHVQA